MPPSATARHALPLLSVAQALKEITHNEALARIDALMHPVIENLQSSPPAGLTDADDGRCWIVGASPTGDWSDKHQKIARWTSGSWRFLEPLTQMQVFDVSEGKFLSFSGSAWISCPAIVDPSGGSQVDSECRSALIALLGYLRSAGFVPT